MTALVYIIAFFGWFLTCCLIAQRLARSLGIRTGHMNDISACFFVAGLVFILGSVFIYQVATGG